MSQFSDQELKDMTLADAEARISNAVYEAARLLEDMENAGKVRGNGHHARQAVALFAVQELRARWTNEDEAKARAEDQKSLTAAAMSAQV